MSKRVPDTVLPVFKRPKYYTGIGSRETPDDIRGIMSSIAGKLARKGWILRSGSADGADLAFEDGAWYADGEAEIYLPWSAFNKEKRLFEPKLETPDAWVYPIAEIYHPNWKYLKYGAKALHARNVHQVLGAVPEDDNSSFVVCWTPSANGGGGTGQAIRIANGYHIPVYDLADEAQRILLDKFISILN